MSKYSKGYKSDKDLAELLRSDLDYNPETGVLMWNKQTLKRDLSTPVGTVHSSGYSLFSTGVNGRVYTLRSHIVIWFLYYGVWPDKKVDHKDRDRLNNKIENLRLATDQENARNQSLNTRNKSGYHGVSWSTYHNKWVARIGIGNTTHKFLGYYDCKTSAALSYDKASVKYHGEYGTRNFIE